MVYLRPFLVKRFTLNILRETFSRLAHAPLHVLSEPAYRHRARAPANVKLFDGFFW